jgi:hypothetical protein
MSMWGFRSQVKELVGGCLETLNVQSGTLSLAPHPLERVCNVTQSQVKGQSLGVLQVLSLIVQQRSHRPFVSSLVCQRGMGDELLMLAECEEYTPVRHFMLTSADFGGYAQFPCNGLAAEKFRMLMT